MSRLIPLLLLTACTCALCYDEFREDFTATDVWTPQPSWLRPAAENPSVTMADGVAHFSIVEPGRGMKWRREVDQADTDLAPWLVFRYKAEGYATEKVDYVVWLDDADRKRDGLKAVLGADIISDGEWHTRVVDLSAAGCIPPINHVAVQCYARADGPAHLWVNTLAITDTPPPGTVAAPVQSAEERDVLAPVNDPDVWTIQPSWLANYSENHACEASPDGTRFSVQDAGTGAKWSRDLDEPVEAPVWVSMRYRAKGLVANPDYALYVANRPGGQAPEEQYAICLQDLIADGVWHVQSARLTVSQVSTLAVQVQAAGPGAFLEIATIRFHDSALRVKVTDVFAVTPGWPQDMGAFRPVALPDGDTSAPELVTRLRLEGDLPSGQVTVDGIPFLLREAASAANMTAMREPAEVAVPLSGRAAELHFILAAQLPSRDEPAFGEAALGSFNQIDRLRVRIEYADGTSEEQFPFSAPAGQHRVSRGLGAYCVAVDPTRDLKSVAFRDGFRRAAFGLLAATLCANPGPATDATQFRPLPEVGAPGPMAARQAEITVGDGFIRVDAWSVAMTLDTRRGLIVTGLENHSGAAAPLEFTPGPLFRLRLGLRELTSADFAVTSIESGPAGTAKHVVHLTCDSVEPTIRMRLILDVTDPREIGMSLEGDLSGQDPAATTIHFPDLRGLRFADDPQDVWYWMPRRGALVNNIPITQREPYGGRMPMQVMGAFSPVRGTGLYVMTQDLESTPRFYRLAKAEGKVDLGVEYAPIHNIRLPRTVIGCSEGDWHAQLARYREWVATWYEPAAPRKQWFREVFNFRQQFLHFALPEMSGMFDPETKTLNLPGVLAKDAEAFGGADYLHIFDWGWDPVHGRCGDYVPWDYLGPPDNFHRAIQEVKDSGVPVGLYIEGYLVDPQSDLGKAKGQQWQLLDAEGNPYAYFAPSYNICSWVNEWQDYLPATYARVREQTGAVGFYIDEYGFAQPGHNCFNKAHGHPIPASPVIGEQQMTRKVREALGPDCAIYTEESPADVTSQYQDGSFTYAISCASDAWSPHHLNLYRFAFPTFKTIEIIVCDKPLGSNVDACRRILFNGEAIWLEGIPDRWFAPETLEYIARMHRVLRENRQCFAGDYPEPLAPVLVEGIYANRFSERADGTGKTCWTVYNTSYRTFAAEALKVAHSPEATYRDELTGEPIPARVEGDWAFLRLNIGPRDVAVISRTVGAGDVLPDAPIQ